MSETPRRVIVIGAGIAGLATAYYLRKHGVKVQIFERDKRVGGLVQTTLEEDRYLIEHGPNSFLNTSESILKLARELSLHEQVMPARPNEMRRYVVRHGKLEIVPMRPHHLLTTPLLSLRAKTRMLAEPFIRTKGTNDESIAAFVRRRFGREVLAQFVDPMVAGIYAGDVEQLSVASVFPELLALEEKYGSIFKGVMRKKKKERPGAPTSFRWGMGTLPARLEEVLRHEIQYATNIESVEQLRNGPSFAKATAGRGFSVHVEAPRKTFEADAVVIATPSWMAARILAPIIPNVISALLGISYASLTVVHTAFRRGDVPHPLDGFGFLVPRREKIRMLGSVWSSSLFPNRAPPMEVLLTNFIGGATDPRAIELDDDEILSHIRNGLETLVGIRAEPSFVHITRYAQAIPQYTIGHRDRMQEIEQGLSEHRGIFLTGNYMGGVSVAETITHAREVADHALKYLGVWSPTNVA